MKNEMTDPLVSEIEDLSGTELLSGLLLFFPGEKFPEQAVYELFRRLESQNERLAGRFRVGGSPGRLRSEPLRRTLNFLEMAKIIETPMPNPVEQYFKPRSVQRDSVRKELEERGALPSHEKLFVKLAKELEDLIHEDDLVPQTRTR